MKKSDSVNSSVDSNEDVDRYKSPFYHAISKLFEQKQEEEKQMMYMNSAS